MFVYRVPSNVNSDLEAVTVVLSISILPKSHILVSCVINGGSGKFVVFVPFQRSQLSFTTVDGF